MPCAFKPCAFKPCALEVNSNGGFKREDVESSNKNIYPILQGLWPPNLAGAPTDKVSWPCDPVAPVYHVTNQKHRVAVATKLGRIVVYLELLPIKLLDPLVMWSCKITWQSKTIIPPHGFIQATVMSGRRNKNLSFLIGCWNTIFVKFYFKTC